MTGAHAHDHTHGTGANARMLAAALGLTGTFLVVEVVAGFAFGSLALISDAAHMFTDAAALAIALAAIRIGQRPADDRRTFGYRRFEIIAAAVNAVLLFGVAVYIFIEGIERFVNPVPVQSVGVLAVAAIGLAINLIAMRLLQSGKETSLNVRGAYLEVWADMLGSIGVLAGAGLIAVTGWMWVDPVIAIAIGLWVLPRTWILLRDSTNILLEGVPRGMVLTDIRAAVTQVAGVVAMHDLHVWVSGADRASASAHVVVREGADEHAVRVAVAGVLRERFGLDHITIQVEREVCAEHDMHP